MRRLRHRLFRCAADESGTATIEFALTLPVVLFAFFAVFEAGMFMTRYVMMDRALDMTVRDLRLGILVKPSFETLKSEVCSRTVIFPQCQSELKLQMQRVSTTTWSFPATPVSCVDRSLPIKPELDGPDLGVPNEAMLIRACITVDAMFPTTGIGLQLKKAGDDGYDIVAVSAYTNEP